MSEVAIILAVILHIIYNIIDTSGLHQGLAQKLNSDTIMSTHHMFIHTHDTAIHADLLQGQHSQLSSYVVAICGSVARAFSMETSHTKHYSRTSQSFQALIFYFSLAVTLAE